MSRYRRRPIESLPQLEVPGYDPMLITQFNQLVSQLSPIPTPAEKAVVEAFLTQIPPAVKDQFRWESLRQIIVAGSQAALTILQEMQKHYDYISSCTPAQLIALAQDEKTQDPIFLEISQAIDRLKAIFERVSLDIYDPAPDGEYGGVFPTYPYQGLPLRDNLELVRICANLAHDLNSLPAFSNFVFNCLHHIDESESAEYARFIARVFSHLHQGAVWTHESFFHMANRSFPMESAELSTVLETVMAETAVRAYGDNGVRRLHWNEEVYTNPVFTEQSLHPNRHRLEDFTLETHIQPGLQLPGNESGLHLLLYQLIKNTVQILKSKMYGVEHPHMTVDAGQCNVQGHPCLVVRMTDNGPGLDLATILRSKQHTLRDHFNQLSPVEQKAAGRWTSLDLRLVDLINFVFERRVSGSPLQGTLHSGIGLALAKELVESHGGCIWVTNLAGERGAEFLIFLDPSGTGALRSQVPELFATDTIPADLLNAVDQQLTEQRSLPLNR